MLCATPLFICCILYNYSSALALRRWHGTFVCQLCLLSTYILHHLLRCVSYLSYFCMHCTTFKHFCIHFIVNSTSNIFKLPLYHLSAVVPSCSPPHFFLLLIKPQPCLWLCILLVAIMSSLNPAEFVTFTLCVCVCVSVCSFATYLKNY